MIDFFVHSFNTLSHGLLGYAVPFLFVLTIVVFFHELGHFLVARWAGVRVLTFSLGFGPELVGFNDRHGTRWKISAIPLGGYVKFFGDESEASTPSAQTLAAMSAEERAGSFHHKKVGPRAAIVAAGPIANFILGALIFAGMALYYGKPSTIARVDGVVANGAAAAAGFKVGDVVIQIDGKPIESFADMQRIVAMNAGSALTFQVKRDGAVVSLTATPALLERKDPFGNSHRLGVLGIEHKSQGRGGLDHPGRRRRSAQDRRRAGLVHHHQHFQVPGLAVRRPGQSERGQRRPGNRENVGAGGQRRVPVRDQSLRGAVGVDRPFEPVPDPAARWRPPDVLCGRGGPWPAFVRADPGNGVPNRAWPGADVDGVCDLQRHPADGSFLIGAFLWRCC
ncbi:membrane-associated protease RseP (regulator of RpoE activity) [Bradyrhizobium yuanmingense]